MGDRQGVRRGQRAVENREDAENGNNEGGNALDNSDGEDSTVNIGAMDQQTMFKLLVDMMDQLKKAQNGSSSASSLMVDLKGQMEMFVADPDVDCAFSAWYRRYSQVILVDGKSLDDKGKVRLLLSKLDSTCFEEFRRHVTPEEPYDVTYDDAVKALKTLFDKTVSKFRMRVAFWQDEFGKSALEDVQQYGDRLRERYNKVMDGMSKDENLVLRFLVGLRGREEAEHLSVLQAFADKEAKTPGGLQLQDVIDKLKDLKDLKSDSQLMRGREPSVRHVSRGDQHASRANHHSRDRGGRKADVVCWNCGHNGHSSFTCAKDKAECFNCGKRGHMAQYCRKKSHGQGQSRGRSASRVRGRNDRKCKAVKVGGCELTKDQGDPLEVNGVRRYQDVDILGVKVTLQSDTGSDVTLIARETWKTLGSPQLDKSGLSLKVANNSDFHCYGRFRCTFALGGEAGEGYAYVVDGANLLGMEWLVQNKSINSCLDVIGYARKVRVVPKDIGQALRDGFPSVFKQGLGKCVKEKARLELLENSKPRFCKTRPVPYAALGAVEEELDRLLEMGVIVPVDHSQWAAPIVTVQKKGTGKIRVCSDFSTGLNKVLVDNEHPLPVPEDIFAKLNGGRIFSQIDLSDAYLQVEVDEESKKLITINTHRGLYQYQRLPFGVKTAPAIFQGIMDKLCSGLRGVTCYLDDVMVKGDTEEEHYDNLVALFRRIEEYGFRVKHEKCHFCKAEIQFLGYVVDKNGRRPDPKKISALVSMEAPKDVAQLKSFLGMVSYYGNFIPQIKAKRGLLDSLTHKDVPWSWNKDHEQAFQEILKVLGSDLNLVHYDPGLPIIVAADACEYGIGGVISHKMPDGSERPIQHFSQALTAAEKNYSQIEKEALGLVSAVKKFHKFVYGRRFLLQTDHKPLLAIYGNKAGLPQHSVNRLIRWGLILLGYDFEIEYVNTHDFGKADALSRLMAKTQLENEDVVIAKVERDVADGLEGAVRPLPITSQQIKEESFRDQILKSVMNKVQIGWSPKDWKKLSEDQMPYFNRRHELAIVGDCLMVGERVVVPQSLRWKVLKELHRGHPGIVRMKRIARGHVFWPGLDKDVEELVRSCQNCQLAAKSPAKVPLHPWPTPERVWERIHIDFAGPDNGVYYLVVVDALSKWPEVVMMTNISAKCTVQALEDLFSKYGYPESVVSDNGTQFTSANFREMCEFGGIRHIKSAPYHPQSNGQAERFVDILKRGLQKLKGEESTTKNNLNRLLLAYRSTPNKQIGYRSPAESFLGRKLRTRLSLLIPQDKKESNTSNAGMKDQFDRKHGVKERKFAPGDKVWVQTYKLNDCVWKQGVVSQRVGFVNYMVNVEGRERKFHANQMRLDASQSKDAKEDQQWFNTMLNVFDLLDGKSNPLPVVPENVLDGGYDDGYRADPVLVPPHVPMVPMQATPQQVTPPPVLRRSTRQRKQTVRFSPM